MNQPPIETESLSLLRELRSLLGRSLDSIAGESTEGDVSYLVWGAVHVNRIVAGYCELREKSMVYASKIMVRPVLEATFSVVAALNNPCFLLEKAYSEYREDLRLVSEQETLRKEMPSSEVSDAQRTQLLAASAADRQAIESAFASFQKEFAKARPSCSIKRERLGAFDPSSTAFLIFAAE